MQDNCSPAEVANMIMLPGFSTAKKLSVVSGRGVGMDAVATQIHSVGGSLEIALPDEVTVFDKVPAKIQLRIPNSVGRWIADFNII